MPQKHDIGWKKRSRPAPPAKTAFDGEQLASDLVNRGLAEWFILEARKRPLTGTDTP